MNYDIKDLCNEITFAIKDYNLKFSEVCRDLGIPVKQYRRINGIACGSCTEPTKIKKEFENTLEKLCEYLDIRIEMYKK